MSTITITSMKDICIIVDNKCDVISNDGYIIPFVRFMNYTLLEILQIINSKSYKFNL